MNEREQIAWIHRRVGWGLAPGELDELEALGVSAVIDRLLDPDAAGIPADPDPWANVTFSDDRTNRGPDRRAAIAAWLVQMTGAQRTLVEWSRWYWHGHLVSSLGGVPDPELLVNQLRTYGALGLGSFHDLIHAATIDPAMLLYLNGNTSVGAAPNENYGRELMELFTLGVGAFTEDDVKAAARALTGWTVARGTGQARFAPARHDDAGQTLLGTPGVHDVDTVVDTVVGDEACAPFVAGRMGRAVLGSSVDPAVVDRAARAFRDSGMQVSALVRTLISEGLDGASTGLVRPPVPWLIAVLRATGARLSAGDGRFAAALAATGQIPMNPPNVSGWPGDQAWLGAGATIARANLASLIAESTPDSSAVLAAARQGDDGALADALGIPAGFGEATRAALADARGAGGRPGTVPLAVALASPELVQA